VEKKLKKAVFSMDCLPDGKEGNIDGMTYGYTWNGWACPYFTYENAMRLAELAPDLHLWYYIEKDSFITTDESYDPQEFEAMIIDGVKYYPIGNYSWCWFDMTESEEV